MKSGYEYDDCLKLVLSTFSKVLGITAIPFGSRVTKSQGGSDGNEGVQRSIWLTREACTICIGINLEGKKYNDWPIARFLEREMATFELLNSSRKLYSSKKVIVGLYRNAWLYGNRLSITEDIIGNAEQLLPDLTCEKWTEMLKEAYFCLDKYKGYRARAKQLVTLRRAGPRLLEVSPQITVHTEFGIHNNEVELEKYITKEIELLNPIYHIIKYLSKE